VTNDDVQRWLDRYVAAWESYDPAAIGELFTEDAEYRYHPADEPVVGRAAIVASWMGPEGPDSDRDQPGTFAAEYRPFVVDGPRAVAIGLSRYWEDAGRSTERSTFDNCFLLEFDAEGRCRSFTEFFIERT
jgi:ketosteroid isomerase-like protein